MDGVDIREWPLSDLRSLFGLVLQDVHLFSGTIADNVRLGNGAISDDQVRQILQSVNAATFVDRLGGIAAPVVERGATLSVGQKQLLSFARALAFDPPVLVLDEATSSIDTETERLIRDALATSMAAARPSPSRIVFRRSRRWIAFSCFTRAVCGRSGRRGTARRPRHLLQAVPAAVPRNVGCPERQP